MSAIINVSLRVDKLPKEKFISGKDGAVYYNFTLNVNNEANQFGQNVSVIDSQTQEEREAKKPKTYLGNGNVVWTDGKIEVIKKEKPKTNFKLNGDMANQFNDAQEQDFEDLPF